jgi:nitrilase
MKIAIIQAAPAYYDLQASLAKALQWIDQAAHQGAQLIVLGESWLSGYPAWLDHYPGAALWEAEATKAAFRLMYESSLIIGSEEEMALRETARKHGAYLVLGANEQIRQGPGRGTLFNSLLTYGPNGRLLNHHRKLMPTFTERLLYGQGDGAGLRTTDLGPARLGGLICWEHWMPMARQTLHLEGEDIHIALWPSVNETHQMASLHYAFEGKCFVLAAGSILQAKDMPAVLEAPENLRQEPELFLLRGGSGVAGPDGKWLIPPVMEEETIVFAELDLSVLPSERMYLDVGGHYHRPDIFQMKVDRSRSNHNFNGPKDFPKNP